MPLAPGSRVGVYEVIERIGVGGMGEVYRARDSRLDRAVALKTLPDEFAGDPERLARFEREAKSLALLNHPHIASIHGLETGTPPALAMEMVEGETLAERIAAGPLPIDEALAIARQIISALEHAHDRGIVHRDLKPANIKAGPRDGPPNVKVLDFGLAKAMMPDAASVSAASAVSSPTITSPANMTRAGIVLGTAAYMAPEQARGKVVDQRADIWAFGCVLFEMLTARRAFEGEEIADVLARVIQSEPDWTQLPAATPRSVKTLLQRCLRKDPARRIHSIADVGIDLEEVATGAPEEARDSAPPARRSWWAAALMGVAAGAAIVAVAMLTVVSRQPALVDAPVVRFTVPMPDGWALFRNPITGRMNFAVSPDGQKLAVVLAKGGARRIFVRRLDDNAFRELPETEGAVGVFWAPDSQRFGFALPTGAIRRADLAGAGSQLMVTLPTPGPTASWGPSDELLSGTGFGTPLYQWSANGGTATRLDELPDDVTARTTPSWLPGDNGYLYVENKTGDRFAVMVTRAGAAQEITSGDAAGAGSIGAQYRSGRLLLSVTEPTGRSVLTAQPLDLSGPRLTGNPSVLVADLHPSFSASETGVLVYGPGQSVAERFVWVDARGSDVATVSTGTERMRPANFDLSPDERFLVIQQVGNSNPLLVHDLTRGVSTSLTVRGTDPIWSFDGKQIAFARVGGSEQGIHVTPAFGGSSRLVYAAKDPTYLDDWSRDGQWLAGHVNITGAGILMPLAANATPILFEDKGGPAGVDETRFSPDGRWLAYGRNVAGTGDVFLIPVPPTGERWQVSVAGGAQPRWRSDGKALYFLSLAGTMMMVDIQMKSGAPPQISAPRALFETGLQVNTGFDQYAVNKDGTRFLIRRPDQAAMAALNYLNVIINWPGLLKESKP